MPQFILIPGAWHGAWCWARVLPLLRAAGHVAHATTLTGVGDRAHLLSKEIRLDTHIRDVLNLIAHEELDDVVLVGHSYAGMVITGVADVLARERRRVLRHLVYLDAVAPHPGESWSSHQPRETVAARVRAAAEGGGICIPTPDPKVWGLKGADYEWVRRRLTPQPFALYQEPLAFDGARVATLPRTYIDCVAPALDTLAAIRRRVRGEPGWRLVELAAGHDPMVSAPRELAQALLACAAITPLR
jgi:pimeloyl-ACP methyl ester carboxylesterase